jgi:hypothetical protein
MLDVYDGTTRIGTLGFGSFYTKTPGENVLRLEGRDPVLQSGKHVAIYIHKSDLERIISDAIVDDSIATPPGGTKAYPLYLHIGISSQGSK